MESEQGWSSRFLNQMISCEEGSHIQAVKKGKKHPMLSSLLSRLILEDAEGDTFECNCMQPSTAPLAPCTQIEFVTNVEKRALALLKVSKSVDMQLGEPS